MGKGRVSLSSSSSGSNYRRCYREIPPEPASPITMAAEPEEVLEVDGDAWMGTIQGQYDYDGPHPQPQRVRRAEPDERRDAPPHIRCDLCGKWVKNIGESLVQHQNVRRLPQSSASPGGLGADQRRTLSQPPPRQGLACCSQGVIEISAPWPP